MYKLTRNCILFSCFFIISIFAVQMIYHFCEIQRGYEVIKRDCARLATILEEDGCLSNDMIDGNSRYKSFVNETLRSSETDIFKYNVYVEPRGRIKNNPDLLGDSWQGYDAELNPLKVDSASYLTAPQRDSVVNGELTLIVYTPTISNVFVDYDDPFAVANQRMKYTITLPVKVISTKYYKGRAVENAVSY